MARMKIIYSPEVGEFGVLPSIFYFAVSDSVFEALSVA